MASLKDRLAKNTKLEGAAFIDKSIYFDQVDFTSTKLWAINTILSGKIDGGVSAGATTIAGESRTFKTLFGLMMMKAYMKKYPDSVVIFYDSEFGAKPAYLKNFGIDTSRVLHVPIKNIEDLKFDLVGQLDKLDRKDKVFIFIDSVGNLASKKELDDTLAEKGTVDMTRAKQLKSLGRMVTPYLAMKDVPLVMIGHTYKTMDRFPQDVVSGGTGIMYISDNILLVKKSQIKDGTVKVGNIFNVIAFKSRFVRENAKIGVPIRFNEKLSPYAGMFDVANTLGYIRQPKKGWWSRVFDKVDEEDKNHRRKDVEFNKEFWDEFLEKSNFEQAVFDYYALEQIDMLDEDSEEVENVSEEE